MKLSSLLPSLLLESVPFMLKNVLLLLFLMDIHENLIVPSARQELFLAFIIHNLIYHDLVALFIFDLWKNSEIPLTKGCKS